MLPREPRRPTPGLVARYRLVHGGLRRWLVLRADWQLCRVVDLGRNGAGLIVSDERPDDDISLQIGDLIRLEFTPTWPPGAANLKVVVDSEVRNRRRSRDGQWRIGVRFEHVSAREKRSLDVLVAPAYLPESTSP